MSHPLQPIAGRLEALADQTDGIDPWCSGPDWVISANRAFGRRAEPLVLGDVDRHAAVLAPLEVDGEVVLAGLDPVWGFACPVLMADPVRDARRLVAAMRDAAAEIETCERIILPGFDEASALFATTALAFAEHGTVFRADGITRCTADLSGGRDAWLGRRSARFRKRWRQVRRRADDAGVRVEAISSSDGLMDRLLAIERQSWKGQQDDGILSSEMRGMYGSLVDLLGAQGRLHVAIATLDGRDVGFILGGVRAGIYRGLQLSHISEVAYLGIGHLLQAWQIDALGPEVHTYDLGMDMPYKRRWADDTPRSAVIVVPLAP